MKKVLLIMISLRIISSMIELTSAYLMYHFNSVKTAIRINAILGLVGPIILLTVTFLGLANISHELPLWKIIITATGILLILLGTK